MTQGRVYLWNVDPTCPLGGYVTSSIAPLQNIEPGVDATRLNGRFVQVHNAGMINVRNEDSGEVTATPLGDACPDAQGHFLFEPGKGGGRIDKVHVPESDFAARYVQAAHFGEVNVYYHLDKMANHINRMLAELELPSLPQVIALVNAHHGATELDSGGDRDGIRGTRQWLPFQGAHYRLPGKAIETRELDSVAETGEIHFGPGWKLSDYGALVNAAGWRYRANASHNAGIIYHEYGHHITRHLADFRANRYRHLSHQDNKKTAIDEGYCDYFAADMLNCPHIWAFHHRHDIEYAHPRSLVSEKTMADFDVNRNADAHANGTIWAAALWDFRAQLASKRGPEGIRTANRAILGSLYLLGQFQGPKRPLTVKSVCRARSHFIVGLAALVQADEMFNDGACQSDILAAIERRGIRPMADIMPLCTPETSSIFVANHA